jgi:hypothetical protein
MLRKIVGAPFGFVVENKEILVEFQIVDELDLDIFLGMGE